MNRGRADGAGTGDRKNTPKRWGEGAFIWPRVALMRGNDNVLPAISKL